AQTCAQPAGRIGRGRRVDIPQPLPGWGYGRRGAMTGEEELRIGLGVDAHALEDGVPLVLGGVRVESARGLAGHSDGDVITHALIDALLGAADMGDIGSPVRAAGST